MSKKGKFSVLMCVCANDNEKHFLQALNSVTHNQTLKPSEFVIIIDGKVNNNIHEIIKNTFEDFHTDLKVKINNYCKGLAYSLNRGIKLCTNTWVARMDADDISLPRRFETQIEYLKAHPDLALLGSSVIEFSSNGEERIKASPKGVNKIRDMLKYKNPINHPSVILNKDKVIKVGGYPNFKKNQDYGLWVKLAANNYKIENLGETCLKFRLTDNFYLKRGLKLLKYDIDLLKYQLDLRYINLFEFIILCLFRTVFRSLPTVILKKVYSLSRD